MVKVDRRAKVDSLSMKLLMRGQGTLVSDAKCFIHLSDIHFGQEKGGEVIFHDDVKEQVIRHVRTLATTRHAAGASPICGVLVTGDIAYSGEKAEYDAAAAWLDRLTAAAGCGSTDVQVVPGNHDIDRKRISTSAGLLFDKIMAGGQKALDLCLTSEMDREVLYDRFNDYRPFAYGYGCKLDQEGGRAGEKRFDLGHGRTLCISGLNSALLCKKKDEPGELILGARQMVFSDEDGVAHVVLSHHPLHWFSDVGTARKYLHNRTTVLLSGHEHQPSWNVEKIDDEPRFLALAAGALVPPHATEEYNYAFNVIEFSLSGDGQGLNVAVHPHCWDRDRLRFTQDEKMFAGAQPSQAFEVRCPCFADAAQFQAVLAAGPTTTQLDPEPAATADPIEAEEEEEDMVAMDPRFPSLRQRFFQRLGAVQRLRVLDDLGAIPKGVSSVPNMTFERMVLEKIQANTQKVDRLAAAIDEQISAAEAS